MVMKYPTMTHFNLAIENMFNKDENAIEDELWKELEENFEDEEE